MINSPYYFLKNYDVDFVGTVTTRLKTNRRPTGNRLDFRIFIDSVPQHGQFVTVNNGDVSYTTSIKRGQTLEIVRELPFVQPFIFSSRKSVDINSAYYYAALLRVFFDDYFKYLPTVIKEGLRDGQSN